MTRFVRARFTLNNDFQPYMDEHELPIGDGPKVYDDSVPVPHNLIHSDIGYDPQSDIGGHGTMYGGPSMFGAEPGPPPPAGMEGSDGKGNRIVFTGKSAENGWWEATDDNGNPAVYPPAEVQLLGMTGTGTREKKEQDGAATAIQSKPNAVNDPARIKAAAAGLRRLGFPAPDTTNRLDPKLMAQVEAFQIKYQTLLQQIAANPPPGATADCAKADGYMGECTYLAIVTVLSQLGTPQPGKPPVDPGKGVSPANIQDVLDSKLAALPKKKEEGSIAGPMLVLGGFALVGGMYLTRKRWMP